jgi:hypothetical protein
METKHTPGPWFVSGVRFKMNGGEWHSINRYDESKKRDENIACVGYDQRTGVGLPDARLIASAPDMFAALTLAANRLDRCVVDCVPNSREWFERSEWADEARAAVAKAEGKS